MNEWFLIVVCECLYDGFKGPFPPGTKWLMNGTRKHLTLQPIAANGPVQCILDEV